MHAGRTRRAIQICVITFDFFLPSQFPLSEKENGRMTFVVVCYCQLVEISAKMKENFGIRATCSRAAGHENFTSWDE